MAFNFNFGANSPATPNRKGKSSISQVPSTTPAGHPPSHLTNFSTTPAGNPPRSSKIFGSSFNAGNNTFGRKGFTVPDSSPPRPAGGDSGYDDEVDADGDTLDDMDLWMPKESVGPFGETLQRGLKRSRNGQVRGQSGFVDIARTMVKEAASVSKLEESDDLVLGTDDIMARMNASVEQWGSMSFAQREETITLATAELAKFWNQQCDTKTLPGHVGPESDEGPKKAAYVSTLLLALHHPATSKPPVMAQSKQRKTPRLASRSSQTLSVPPPRALLDWLNTHHNPFPDEFAEVHLHQPAPSASEGFWDTIGADLLRGRLQRVIRLLKDAGWQHAEIAREDNGGRTAGYRGRQLDNVEEVVARCIKVLEACPAFTEDDWNVTGSDWQLFRQRVRHAVRDLEAYASAPSAANAVPEEMNAFTRANVGKSSMTAATHRAESKVPLTMLQNLKGIYSVLLGGKAILDYAQDWLEGTILLTVWWDGDEISAALDASLADMRISKLGAMKSLRRSTTGAGTREVDVAPLVAYRRKLGDMFACTLDEVEEFQPDSLDPIQVGLVSVIEQEEAPGAVAAAIGMLRTWSPTVSSATVEMASLGTWLPEPEGRPTSRGLMKELSSENLMVLSYGPGGQAQKTSERGDGIVRDEVLTDYASLLAQRENFRSQDGRVEREGWELAVGVLSRLDNTEASQELTRDIIGQIQIEDESGVEKVLGACQSMGFGELGRGIAERYADTLASQTPPPYGKAVIYYARANAAAKLKDTLSLLISLCLLQSAAMPPTPSLDEDLASLLSTERSVLLSLARTDAEAAQLLGKWLSGYAMLRRFYEIRDQDVSTSTTTMKKMGSLERKREASKLLIAVTEAAADCIKGGLFDPEVEGVVLVEGVLALLGEVLPLLGQGGAYGQSRILSYKQVLGLMSVVEDFEQISGRIQDGASGLLSASMGAYRGESGSGRMAKSKSDVSNGSGSGSLGGSGSWEMLAESSFVMLQSTESVRSGRSGSRGKVSQIERGWDWRKGLDAVAATGSDVGAKEVLLLLRTALAREVAQSWAGGLSQ